MKGKTEGELFVRAMEQILYPQDRAELYWDFFIGQNVGHKKHCATVFFKMLRVETQASIRSCLMGGGAVEFRKIENIPSGGLAEIFQRGGYSDSQTIAMAFDTNRLRDLPPQPWPLFGHVGDPGNFIRFASFNGRGIRSGGGGFGLSDHLIGGLSGLSGLPQGGSEKPNAYYSRSPQPKGPSRHLLLGFKIALGAPLIPTSFWLSVLALRRCGEGDDLFGFLMFLSGGVVSAAGVAILVM